MILKNAIQATEFTAHTVMLVIQAISPVQPDAGSAPCFNLPFFFYGLCGQRYS